MSENVAESSVDLRVQRTRKHLVRALMDLMQEKPFQKILVRDITARAMVNRSTFYAHFDDKYDLFRVAVGQQMRCDLRDGLSGASGFTEANLRRLLVTCAQLMSNMSSSCFPTPRDDLMPLIMSEMQAGIYDLALAWAQDTESIPQPEAVALYSAGTIMGAVVLWGRRDDPDVTAEQLADQIMPLLMGGVGGGHRVALRTPRMRP